MSGKKRIKISKIEEQMHDVGAKISIIKSLTNILLETFRSCENLKPQDPECLTVVINNLTDQLIKDFENIENILQI